MITELYTVYRDELYRYCRRMCGNERDAEDLLQETFLKALSETDLMEELGEHERRAWLYRVARNRFYDLCRRRTVEREHPPACEEETDSVFSEAETAMILSSLPPEMSRVFVRRYFEGYTSKELAEEYDMTPSGIRTMLARARRLLRDKMSDKGNERGERK